MIEDVRIALKKEIEELITKINDSRNEAPEPVLKYLRKILLKTKKEIFTIGKHELKDRLEYVFLKLANVKSQSENLAKAYAIAFKLWRNFPNYRTNLKTGEPMGK